MRSRFAEPSGRSSIFYAFNSCRLQNQKVFNLSFLNFAPGCFTDFEINSFCLWLYL